MSSDYHVHTNASGDAKGEMELFVERAIDLGFSEIGFSEHLTMDLFGGIDPAPMMNPEKWIDYEVNLRDIGEKYHKRIAVKFGIEADYVPGKEDVLRQFLACRDFDYAIGAVHFLGDWPVDFSGDDPVWKARPINEIYDDYFRTLLAGIESGLFDIIAHADLVKKFGHRPDMNMREWYEKIAQACVKTGTVVEVNSAGLRKPVGEIYPAPDCLKICFEKNVPIVINSDAHCPEQLGSGRAQAVKVARKIGYRKTPLFTDRAITGWCDLS